MKTALTALAVIAAIIAAIAVGISAAVFVSTATAEVQTQEEEGSVWNTITYEWCVPLDDFANRMKAYGGRLAATGKVPGNIISVIVFPDSSFGIFIYDPDNDIVCNVSIGSLVETDALPKIPI